MRSRDKASGHLSPQPFGLEVVAADLGVTRRRRGTTRAIRIPTLLLSGGKNAGGFNDLVDGYLHQLIPGAERVILPGASHEMFLDFPEASAREMLRHFERHGEDRDERP